MHSVFDKFKLKCTYILYLYMLGNVNGIASCVDIVNDKLSKEREKKSPRTLKKRTAHRPDTKDCSCISGINICCMAMSMEIAKW